MRSATICGWLFIFWDVSVALAAGGILNLSVHDETTGEPVTTRVEIFRAGAADRPMPIRKTVPAGFGVVLDQKLELSLADGGYRFRMVRGPEYRIISGNFSLERTSLDDHRVDLPRMVDMRARGWTSGDCLVVASQFSLPLRMLSEDLHVAAVVGHMDAKPIPRRGRDNPPMIDPMWISEDVRCNDGLAFYGGKDDALFDSGKLPSQWLTATTGSDDVRVAIEHPFAWATPVWLASGRIDGVFILGDWLRLDRKVLSVKDGRETGSLIKGDEKSVGRWAEQIYWNMLEAGFRIPPLAGSGDQGTSTPVGYNRLYVADPISDYDADSKLEASPIETAERWWQAAWQGQSVATNGPLLRPKLGGRIPGHIFKAISGEVLQLQPEVMLTVRDPVDYLEVIHNGRVHYSARLDEFAKAGGQIPSLFVKESGWIMIRVVTLFDDHYRAAISAPWYVEFDDKPRVTAQSVEFFKNWLSEYEQRLKRLPPDQLMRQVPFVRAARAFWADRAKLVTP